MTMNGNCRYRLVFERPSNGSMFYPRRDIPRIKLEEEHIFKTVFFRIKGLVRRTRKPPFAFSAQWRSFPTANGLPACR